MFKILLHFHAQKAFETCTLCHNIVAICVVTMYFSYCLSLKCIPPVHNESEV